MTEASFLGDSINRLLDSLGVDEYRWCIEISLIDNKVSCKSMVRSLDGNIDELFEGFRGLAKEWRRRGIEVTLRRRDDRITMKAEVDLEDLNILMDALLSYLPFLRADSRGGSS